MDREQALGLLDGGRDKELRCGILAGEKFLWTDPDRVLLHECQVLVDVMSG